MSLLKLCYSLLCGVKLFWIVAPNICVCKVHDNTTMKAERLKQLGFINSPSLKTVAEELCSDTHRLTLVCTENVSHARTSHSHTPKRLQEQGVTWWHQWPTKKKKTMKKKWMGKERPSLRQKTFNRDVKVARST